MARKLAADFSQRVATRRKRFSFEKNRSIRLRAVEPFAEVRLPAPVALGPDVGPGSGSVRGAAVGIVGLLGRRNGARARVVEQRICDLAVMRLPGGHAGPDRESLRVDDTWILVVSRQRDRARQ